jgi:diphthamide synthase (EF-2-diphthine--ammonia ligase)
MHAVRRSLVLEQAGRAGLPLKAFDLPWPCSNDEYQQIMAGAFAMAVNEGVECIAFGDLFLEDVRAYREEQLKPTGLQPVFPIWGVPTNELAQQMVDAGVRAKITCIDSGKLGREFAGCDWHAVRGSFPTHVDPCGEQGEFHTFAYAGPMFSTAIPVQTGEIVERDGFVFADVTLLEG